MDHSGLALVLSGSIYIYIVVVGVASARNKPLAPHALTLINWQDRIK